MTILAQLSDLHLRAGGDDRGAARRPSQTPSRRCSSCAPSRTPCWSAATSASAATAAEYALARELLAPLPMPVHVLAGNHDDHEALSEAFGTPARYTADVGELRAGGLRHAAARAAARAGSTSTGSRPSSRPRAGGPVVDRHAPPAAAHRHPGARRDRAARAGARRARRPAHALPERPPRRRRPRPPHRVRRARRLRRRDRAEHEPAGHGSRSARAPSTSVPEPPGFLLHVELGGELVSHLQTLPRGD